MKKILIKRFLLAAALVAGMGVASKAQPIQDADPALTSMSFAKSPVTEASGMLSDTTLLTVTFLNNGFNAAVPQGYIQINISLPTSGEFLAFPENTGALSGTILSKFNWTYVAATKTFQGVNNVDILPGVGGTINVTVKGFISVLSRTAVTNIIKLTPVTGNNVNNDNLTATLGVAPPGVVAVGLLNFDATAQSKSVLLNWQTTSELNSKNFDVEYSIDAVKFSSIGTVAAAGNSTSTKSYSLVHTQPINGVNYYRLKQVNLDGSFTYSPIRKVKFGSRTAVYAMPNPTADNVYLVSGDGGSFAGSVSVYSIEGRHMQDIPAYNYGSAIDMSRFPSGTYILKVIGADKDVQVLQVVRK